MRAPLQAASGRALTMPSESPCIDPKAHCIAQAIPGSSDNAWRHPTRELPTRAARCGPRGRCGVSRAKRHGPGRRGRAQPPGIVSAPPAAAAAACRQLLAVPAAEWAMRPSITGAPLCQPPVGVKAFLAGPCPRASSPRRPDGRRLPSPHPLPKSQRQLAAAAAARAAAGRGSRQPRRRSSRSLLGRRNRNVWPGCVPGAILAASPAMQRRRPRPSSP